MAVTSKASRLAEAWTANQVESGRGSARRLAPAKDPATGEEGSARAAGRSMAGGRGFEPRHTDPESAVLPLDEPPVATGFYHSALLGTITAKNGAKDGRARGRGKPGRGGPTQRRRGLRAGPR